MCLPPVDMALQLNHDCHNVRPVNTTIFITVVQRWTNVEDVGPTLYKCYTNALCLLRDVYRISDDNYMVV